jgi:tetratricopeptide (TPR) repeat protein
MIVAGMPAVEPSSHSRRFSPLPLFQREVALVLVLCVVSAALFAATRSIANWQHDKQVQDAASLYQRGRRELAAGRTGEGIADLRRALFGDRGNPRYTLSLARALADTDRDEEAAQLLLRLRDLHPDDAEINLRLARLVARAGRPVEAVRYYNHAIYGIATLGEDHDRGPIRQELARFLLNEGDRDGALTELGALARELPKDPAAHLEIASLFERAGDLQQARAHYEAGADLDPQSWAALVGAGEASFALHDYARAARQLGAAGRLSALTNQQQQHLETAERIEAADPLATGLGMSARVARLSAGMKRAAARLAGCSALPAGGASKAGATAAENPVRSELAAFSKQPKASLRDSDVLARGVDLLARTAAEAERRCGTRDSGDEAWILIGKIHGEKSS